ncbi:MAG: pyridoxal 5'-phosphate synthase glutaminase subunit PdxT [Acidobacteriota bacterium]|nr:pyridoxal 5'-phosphate synthase glutaminase subunit PdxT [Acidobacteriota bacterium]
MIGILALQGGFEAHGKILDKLGLPYRQVRLARDLEGLEALILPGGESTTMLKLMDIYDLFEPLARFGASGKPVLGTCAGAILMSRHVDQSGQRSFGWLPVSIERNAYGSQRESFREVQDIPAWNLTDVPALYIRAPRFTELPADVTVLSRLDGDVTGISRHQFTAVTYHPELMDDVRFHRAWYQYQVAPLSAGAAS